MNSSQISVDCGGVVATLAYNVKSTTTICCRLVPEVYVFCQNKMLFI